MLWSRCSFWKGGRTYTPPDENRWLARVQVSPSMFAFCRRASRGVGCQVQISYHCVSVGSLSAANASLRSSTVSGGSCTGGGWSISLSIPSAIFCSAMRWFPTASAHKAAYRHPASHGVGSRLLASIRRRVAKKAVSLAKLLGSAWLFTANSPSAASAWCERNHPRPGCKVVRPSRSVSFPITPLVGVPKARPAIAC